MTNKKLYFEQDGKLHIESDCKHIMLVLTNATNNNNKFYEILLNDDGVVEMKWGRVGAGAQTSSSGGGFVFLCRKAREKFVKGYRPVQILDNDIELSQSLDNSNKINLLDIAINQLMFSPPKKLKTYGDKEIELVRNLISHLVESNRHSIMETSGNKIQIDDSGLVKTELGALSMQNINDAMKLLFQLNDDWNKFTNNLPNNYVENLNKYLMLIPQRVPTKRNWHMDFFEGNKFANQFDFLERLKESVYMYEKLLEDKRNELEQYKSSDIKTPTVFERQLRLVTNKKTLKEIEEFFNNSKNKTHSSYNLKLKHVYEIVLVDADGKVKENTSDDFIEKSKTLGNVNRYWHGTRKFNILSILKNGLIIPKTDDKTFSIAGRMFGDGVYFANQSTKSLNYSQGYWDSNKKDNHCFMFLADVVMGNPFKAGHKEFYNLVEHKYPVYPVKGYDSTIATGGRNNLTHAGNLNKLSNNEMIVYDLSQINWRYLCEFQEN